jgi:uncharacterized membrane protein
MKYNQYQVYKLLIVIILAAIVSGFVVKGNFIIPLIVLLIAVILMFILKKNVKEALTDERIEKIAGKVSRIIFSAAVLLMAIAGLVLIALRERYPEYYLIGNILAYFACIMLFVYSILFKYYSRKE